MGLAPHWGSAGELALVAQEERADGLTNSAATPAHIQVFELTHPKVSPIGELLDCVKGLVLQIQSCRIS